MIFNLYQEFAFIQTFRAQDSLKHAMSTIASYMRKNGLKKGYVRQVKNGEESFTKWKIVYNPVADCFAYALDDDSPVHRPVRLVSEGPCPA